MCVLTEPLVQLIELQAGGQVLVGSAADSDSFFERIPARRKVDAVVVLAFPVSDAERRRLDLMGVSIVAAGGQSAAYP